MKLREVELSLGGECFLFNSNKAILPYKSITDRSDIPL